MTKSLKVGPIRVRPHIRIGIETGKWFVDIPGRLTGNGQRKRKLFDNRRKALEAARRLRRGLEFRSLGFAEVTKKSGLMLRDVAARWVEREELRVRTLKKRRISLEIDHYRLQHLSRFFEMEDLASITERRIVDYQDHRLRKGRRPSTVNSEVCTLMKVLRWAVRYKLLGEVPRVEQIPVEPRAVDIPTPQEVKRLLDALPPSARPVIWFIAETGCRSGEAFNLTWDCVDEVNGWVEFRTKEGWTPKTRQSRRRIPIGGELLEMIRALPKEGPYVFPPTGNANKPRDNVKKVLAGATVRAGLMRDGRPMRITPQVLRKAYATWHAMNGTPQRILQALLGHAAGTRVTDCYYVQATDDAKRAAANVIRLRQSE